MIQETFPIIVSGVEVLNERILLTHVENGLLMNGYDRIACFIDNKVACKRGKSSFIVE